jgi:hypothetical protein
MKRLEVIHSAHMEGDTSETEVALMRIFYVVRRVRPARIKRVGRPV